MMDGWIFFIFGTMIRYHGLLIAYKVEFGSVPNLSNYGYFFIKFNVECLLWYVGEECGDVVHIWYSYQVPCISHVCEIAFDSVPNMSNLIIWPLVHTFCVLLWYLREEWVDYINFYFMNCQYPPSHSITTYAFPLKSLKICQKAKIWPHPCIPPVCKGRIFEF